MRVRSGRKRPCRGRRRGGRSNNRSPLRLRQWGAQLAGAGVVAQECPLPSGGTVGWAGRLSFTTSKLVAADEESSQHNSATAATRWVDVRVCPRETEACLGLSFAGRSAPMPLKRIGRYSGLGTEPAGVTWRRTRAIMSFCRDQRAGVVRMRSQQRQTHRGKSIALHSTAPQSFQSVTPPTPPHHPSGCAGTRVKPAVNERHEPSNQYHTQSRIQ